MINRARHADRSGLWWRLWLALAAAEIVGLVVLIVLHAVSSALLTGFALTVTVIVVRPNLDRS